MHFEVDVERKEEEEEGSHGLEIYALLGAIHRWGSDSEDRVYSLSCDWYFHQIFILPVSTSII